MIVKILLFFFIGFNICQANCIHSVSNIRLNNKYVADFYKVFEKKAGSKKRKQIGLYWLNKKSKFKSDKDFKKNYLSIIKKYDEIKKVRKCRGYERIVFIYPGKAYSISSNKLVKFRNLYKKRYNMWSKKILFNTHLTKI